jgi:starch phosphorylase
MARLTPQFSANRAVSQYTGQYYIPGAEAYRERAAEKGAMGAEMVNWQQALEQKWVRLRFGEMRVETNGEQHVFGVQVYLNGLDPDTVCVELYADGVNGGDPIRQEMMRGERLVGAGNGYVYTARVPVTRPAADYTARVRPRRLGVATPLEAANILWQR